jgi:hypothetical protein
MLTKSKWVGLLGLVLLALTHCDTIVGSSSPIIITVKNRTLDYVKLYQETEGVNHRYLGKVLQGEIRTLSCHEGEMYLTQDSVTYQFTSEDKRYYIFDGSEIK